ncbi:MAG TPA: class F sortase [Amycolatopsis sp.]|nr:class F sortase [Amycolatopsis sp.]
MSKRILGRRGGLLALAGALVAVLATLAFVFGGGPGAPAAGPPDRSSGALQVASPEQAGNAVAAMPRSDPVSLDIPKIDAHSSLIPLGLNADNTVEVPPVKTPLQAGWYKYAPTPGEVGPAVILGHVDGNKQKGIFYRLKELAPGDRVSVARKDGTTAVFAVTKVDQVPKDRFEKAGVYDDTPGPELRLITCGGYFDRTAHNYVDNIIVYARLIQG